MPKRGRIVGYGGGGVRSAFEVRWASNRPPAHRPPAVRAGDRVLYRTNAHMDDLAEAIIVDVLDTRDNPQEYHPGGIPVDDPWPWVLLRVDPATIPASWDKRRRATAALTVKTKEARLAGSAGYLHPLWRTFPQPVCGAKGM